MHVHGERGFALLAEETQHLARRLPDGNAAGRVPAAGADIWLPLRLPFDVAQVREDLRRGLVDFDLGLVAEHNILLVAQTTTWPYAVA